MEWWMALLVTLGIMVAIRAVAFKLGWWHWRKRDAPMRRGLGSYYERKGL